MFEKPVLAELGSESDVEQKLIMPLLTNERPFGFDIPLHCIQTKTNTKRFVIGKGAEQKSYFPDYLIVIGGLPIGLIEAKKPGEDILLAYREARLYAAELNAAFPSGTNPLTRIMASNGEVICAGMWDDSSPSGICTLDEIGVYSERFQDIQRVFSITALQAEFDRVNALIRPKKFWKPRRLVGGLSIQQEEVGHNSFGATISAELSHVFNPATIEDRVRVAKDGYVTSRRRDRYTDPIDRVIRAARPVLANASKLIDDTGKPSEVVKQLSRGKQLEHQVLLIVGGVGVGKTTFIDHLKTTALPVDLRASTVWVNLNMNVAPSSRMEIYDWLRKQIIEGIQTVYDSIDFDLLEHKKKLYSVEVNRFHKGRGQLLVPDSADYNRELNEVIKSAEQNLHDTTVAYCRYCGGDRGQLVIIVLDNCDKRRLEDQLLMFEAAQWLQREFRALVILPLREETYDNHRDQPPLDTALKDLVFRIEPPPFQAVLVKRVQLALDELSQSAPKNYHFQLPNGFQVEYAASDQAYYLSTIIRSIFEYDKQVRRMIIGLSGRNLRRAFEIFLEFCTSGHIGENEIVKITQTKGNYVLPLEVVVTVLLRMNRRFYDSGGSYLNNTLASDAKDRRPTYFSKIIILRWLEDRFTSSGTRGLKGYHPLHELFSELNLCGIEPEVVRRDVEELAQAHCIMTEDFRVQDISDEDLIRIAPAGFVHLDLLDNAYYWGAVAEDTWFDKEEIARTVADRIRDISEHYKATTTLLNAQILVEYLVTKRNIELRAQQTVVETSTFAQLTDLSLAQKAVEKLKKVLVSGPWVDVPERYPIGSIVFGLIVNAVPYGLFVELEPGVTGLLHISKLPKHFKSLNDFAVGEQLKVEITGIDQIQRRIGLKLAG